ncbi:MAG TPA: hypothetical protein VGH28_29795 [Polyangiaceae bacterium]|jgi:hypothetical protein
MKRLVAAACLAVLAIGCKSSGAKKLEGSWRGIKATNVAPEQVSAANLFASTMELEFHGEQVSVHVGGDKQSGHFRVVQDDKSHVVLYTDQDGPSDPQTFTFKDDHTIDWAVDGARGIEFQKE